MPMDAPPAAPVIGRLKDVPGLEMMREKRRGFIFWKYEEDELRNKTSIQRKDKKNI